MRYFIIFYNYKIKRTVEGVSSEQKGYDQFFFKYENYPYIDDLTLRIMHNVAAFSGVNAFNVTIGIMSISEVSKEDFLSASQSCVTECNTENQENS